MICIQLQFLLALDQLPQDPYPSLQPDDIKMYQGWIDIRPKRGSFR